MKLHPHLTISLIVVMSAIPSEASSPVIGNVSAVQRPGTKLVDIDYDITGIATPVGVSMDISIDGGVSWAIPANTLSGAIGTSVTPGRNLRVTWDAGSDWDNQASGQVRFRIKADDTPPDSAVFALIPGSNFTMGDTLDGDSDATSHTIKVSSFFMQKLGVTKANWDVVRTWGLAHGYTNLAAGAGKASSHPVQTLTWYDVVKWCNARSEMEGFVPCYYTNDSQTAVYRSGSVNISNPMVKWNASGYRLPTEAEREKAARGGLSSKRFPWGDTISHSQSNYAANSAWSYDVSPTQGYHPTYAVISTPYTSPVGSFAANGYGLYDMAGNVAEMVWDWYDSGYYAVSPAVDPRGPATGTNRTLRGGSWHSEAYNERIARRDKRDPYSTYYGIGFRPVRVSVVTADSPSITVNSNTLILTVNALHGSVTGVGPYALNATATVTATADQGYSFSHWSGDATGTSNPLSILMNANKSVTANFITNAAPSFSGYAINTAFQTPATVSLGKLLAKASDADGDAITVTAAGPATTQNGSAVLQGSGILYTPHAAFAGTDTFPVIITDAHGASTTGTVTITVGPSTTTGGATANPPVVTLLTGGRIGLRFQGIPGRSYQIQRSTDMGTWTTIATATASPLGTMTFTDETPPQPSAFYRLALP